jgi:hypothetical protein
MSILLNKYAAFTAASESAAGDGATLDFATGQNIKSEKLLWVTVDGSNMTLNEHYSVSLVTNTITFVTAPALGQKVNVKYIVR